MVNDSIADEMASYYGMAERPIVVRNIPQLWLGDDSDIAEKRRRICCELNVDPETAFIIMYHGVVAPGRGVELVIDCLSYDLSLCAVVLGNGEENYLNSLRKLAERKGVLPRILFLPAVPRECLESYVATANIGMVVVEAASKSYYYMLPNKFFENIQAEVPIIASDFPETSKLVLKYKIGLLCNPADTASMHKAIEIMRNDLDLYCQFKTNIKQAKLELCWENEERTLREAYERLFASISLDSHERSGSDL